MVIIILSMNIETSTECQFSQQKSRSLWNTSSQFLSISLPYLGYHPKAYGYLISNGNHSCWQWEPFAITETALSSGPMGIIPVDNVSWNRVSPIPVHSHKPVTYDQYNYDFHQNYCILSRRREMMKYPTMSLIFITCKLQIQ